MARGLTYPESSRVVARPRRPQSARARLGPQRLPAAEQQSSDAVAGLRAVCCLVATGSKRRVVAALLVLCCALPAANAQAQTATAPALTAAFLYNFAKFTEWPAEVLPANAALVLCVAGDSRVHKALEAATRGRDVAGHPLVVRNMELQGPVHACHLLYADDLDTKRALQLLERLRGAPVLSISDLETFAQLGGSANIFSEDGRMRFAVNLDATQRTKLRLSSNVLRLAQIVRDAPYVSQR